jgi:hypothetical protein
MLSKNIISQIVIGSPGSGKTTYCLMMNKFLLDLGKHTIVINLDPGNIQERRTFGIDLCTLINMNEIVSDLHFGPNGSILYCLEYLEKNLCWLEKKIQNLSSGKTQIFILFDFPGQTELYTHYSTIRNLLQRFTQQKFNLVGVILSDFFFFKDYTIRQLLHLSNLMMMINIELPFLHILNKVDLFYSKKVKNKNFDKVLESVIFYKKVFLKKNSFLWSSKIILKLKVLLEDFIQIKPYPLYLNDTSCLKKIIEKIGSIFGPVITPV